MALIDSRPEDYLVSTTDRRTVENWHVNNRDSKGLEKVCKEKVLESSEIHHLFLEETDLDTEISELARKATLVQNPYKHLWEQKGASLAFLCLYKHSIFTKP